ECPALEVYLDDITSEIRRRAEFDDLRVMCEPGRLLVAGAGVIDAEVILVTDRGARSPRWAFLDVGTYNGLGEACGEAIRYHVRSSGTGRGVRPVLAGPSCDSTDVLYRDRPYLLPEDLRAGDHVQLLATGAYTSAYATVGFNGIPPLAVQYL